MRKPPAVVTLVLLLLACAPPADRSPSPAPAAQTSRFEPVPDAVGRAIQKEFPGALPYAQAVDALLERLERFGIPAESILWGQSTCVDDITNTKNRRPRARVKGPFNFGGLAGLPFTGITGFEAFAHHVPDEGTALISVGPHVGYDEREGWGRIIRHDQHLSTSCCGSLAAALSKVQSGEPIPQTPVPDDYQQGVIEQFAWEHRDEITSSDEPLLALTRLIYVEAQNQVASYASKVKARHFKYAVVVGAIIVNTHFAYPDYLWVDRVSIFDVERNEWVEGGGWSPADGG
jgi:hypothetical protein